MSPRRYRNLLGSFEKEIAGGSDLSEAMAKRPWLFGDMDVMLVHIGEQTGQLAEILKSMGDWYEQSQTQRRMVLSGLLYPAFILNVAAFLLPIPIAVLGGGGMDSYRHYVVTILASMYIPPTAAFLLAKLTPNRGIIRRIYDSVIVCIPLLGSAFRCLAIGRYSSVFAIMYKAGIPILRCAELAPQACGNLAVAAQFKGGYDAAKTGSPMSEGFGRALPPDFLELWAVGEESGDLDKTSEKLADIYMDKAQFRFNLIAFWTPRIVYFAILFVMAYLIIRSIVYIYTTMINRAMDF
jgi:type II secretory pathway component PulF